MLLLLLDGLDMDETKGSIFRIVVIKIIEQVEIWDLDHSLVRPLFVLLAISLGDIHQLNGPGCLHVRTARVRPNLKIVGHFGTSLPLKFLLVNDVVHPLGSP